MLSSETVIRYQNCVGCSELAFAVELCVVRRNSDSLPKLCQLQRISIRYRVVCCAANGDSLPKLCRLQRINNSLPSGVFCSELAIRCQSGVVCSKSLPKLSWLQRNGDSLPKLWCQQRNSFCCRTGCLQRNSCRCRIGQPAANQFSLLISRISLLGRNELNASNNFMV